jgi:MFS family permease
LSAKLAGSSLAPFGVRSFRYQWPADLATSWAFEMELLILGWYILVETGSVLMLTAFASLQYHGTLISPMFGVMGDRIGHRNVLCGMRILYAALAVTLMALVFLGVLTPMCVFVAAATLGLVRPSDLVMRYSLIGATMPPGLLIGAMSMSRTTVDSARIAGALAGAGIVATLGMGPAYAMVACLYSISFVLTLRVGNRRGGPVAAVAQAPAAPALARTSPWRDLRDVFAHVWDRPQLRAGMYYAFLINLTAFPLVQGLLPYVAKDVYHADQTVLGYLVAGFACGALAGSIVLSRYGSFIRPGRMMIIAGAMWYLLLLVFAHQHSLSGGIAALVIAGFAQGLCLIPLSTMLMRTSDERFRGRVLGIRMLAIYGLPLGLLLAGPLIGSIDYAATATLYCGIGLMFTLLIAVRWRDHLWRIEAPANRR